MNSIDRNIYKPNEIITNKAYELIKKKPEIKKSDMNETLLTVCLEKINYYVEKYLTDGAEQQIELATKYIKEEMDKSHGPTWTCIIGEAFAFNIKSQTEAFLYCYLGDYGILLYKC